MPGSQGPRQSGSVIVPTDVPTQTSTISLGSHLIFFVGGGLVFSSQFVDVLLLLDEELDDTADADDEDDVNGIDNDVDDDDDSNVDDNDVTVEVEHVVVGIEELTTLIVVEPGADGANCDVLMELELFVINGCWDDVDDDDSDACADAGGNCDGGC